MKLKNIKKLIFRSSMAINLSFLLVMLLSASAWAWPADSQWLELVKGGSLIQDNESDANGGVNVVPDDGTHAAAYIYNDGTYLYYRLRIDGDPTQGGNGVFAQFGWGFEIDTDQNADDYEWLIMCDGISQPEVISLRENTDKTGLGDPSDKAEFIAAEYPLVGNHRLTVADTTIGGDTDYFLDFRMPYAVFKAETGITNNSLIRYFAGSSRSTNNLTDNGADLVAGSTLYEMASDYITPFGTLPTSMTFYNGTTRFVEDISGFGDLTLAAPGDTVYIRVDDLDLNTFTNPGGTLVVTVSSPTGDSERVTLSATGVQGKFTGALPTSSTSNSNGTLYILDNQTATVTYVEAVAANRSQSVDRSDSLLFTAAGTDIGITTTVDSTVANENDTVTFTVTATNNGPSAVATFSVVDALPAGLTLVSATPSLGTYSGGVWTGGALSRYASATLILQATIDTGTNGSILTNTASLNLSTPNDSYPVNDSDSANVAVGGTDLRVTKTVDNPVPTEGDNITYTVRIFNLGPTDTTGVQIQDLLPAGVTYSSDDSGGSYDAVTGLWNVGFLANGAGVLLRINAIVDVGTFGQIITNTASLLASDQPDTDPSNNSETTSIKVDFLDLELTKEAQKVSPPPGFASDSISANQGDTVDFTITLINNGPHDATGVQVTDTLPVGVTYVSSTISQGTFYSGTGLWDIGTLNNGSTSTLTIRVTVDNGTAGQTLLNQASITAVDQPDSNPGNESDIAAITVDGTDLQVIKSVNNGTPNPGDTVVWTVVVTNNGPNQATGVALTDILPTGITYVSDTTSQGSYDAGKKNSSWVWTVGSLNITASATLTITTTVDSGTTGQTIVNAAMITETDQSDPDSSNNVDSEFIAVSGTDLVITKVVDNNTPDLGQNVTYTLTATNTGPGAASSVIVNDLLPPEVSYQSYTASQGIYDSASGIWDIDNLANGASVTLDLVAQVLNDDSGNLIITNTANINATEGDPDLNNNTTSVDIYVIGTDLKITKAVDKSSPYEGESIVYTINVANLGSNQATNVEIEDILPTGTTYDSSVPSQGSYAAGLWFVGNVAGNSSATLAITATVNPFTNGATITNTANLIALDQIDTNSTNNTASVIVSPLAPASLTLIKTSDVATAQPGATITYTLIVTNTGSGTAANIAVDDAMSDFTDLNLDPFGTGNFFNFIDGSSGRVSPGTPNFTTDASGDITSWQLPMNGNMQSSDNFTLIYQATVE